MKKIPLRRCIVTREQLPKQELLRIVRDKEGKVPEEVYQEIENIIKNH